MQMCETKWLGEDSLSHIANAISELEHQKDTIDRALSALRGIAAVSGKNAAPNNSAVASPAKRRLSAQGRRNIIEAAKKRWAAIHAAKNGTAPKKAAPVKKAKKRVLSAEARKKMADAAKKRWAAQKKKAA